MIGLDGKEFIKWSVEELTAWGKVAYRKSDNSWIPMLRDGTCLEGLVIRKSGPFGPKGTVVEPIPTVPMDFWAYALAYQLTESDFMWQVARSIALGSGFGDIGVTSNDSAELNYNIHCVDPYALMGFLELYKKTQYKPFLGLARQIGDNILNNRFYQGFFAPSNKHVYTRFNSPESLALLHLYVASIRCHIKVPAMWPSLAFFEYNYRNKDQYDDTSLIYRLTELSEPPISLQEAAATGNVDLVRSLIKAGSEVNGIEDNFLKTALHRAVISGHKDVVELLVVEGADIEAGDLAANTSLHYAAEKGHKEIAELLIAKGADVNAKDKRGRTPLWWAKRRGHPEIVELLRKPR